MQNFGMMLQTAFDILNFDMELWGFHFSFFNLLAFDVIVSTLGYAVYRLVNYD